MDLSQLVVADFYITLRRSYRKYKILVRQTLLEQFREQFSAIGRTNTIVLESNRPAWYRQGVRHRQEWQFVSGRYKWNSDIEEIQRAIDEHLKTLLLSSK